MRRLRINVPRNEHMEFDVNTIERIANKHDLEYDAIISPRFKVTDLDRKEDILLADGDVVIYVSGPDERVGKFMEEVKIWVTDI